MMTLGLVLPLVFSIKWAIQDLLALLVITALLADELLWVQKITHTYSSCTI